MFKNINTETAFNRAGVACLAVSAFNALTSIWDRKGIGITAAWAAFTVLAVALDACGIKLGTNASFALACLGMGVPFMSGIALKGIAAVWC